MKNIMNFKKLILFVAFWLTPILTVAQSESSGGGDAGGAQGVMDQNKNLYFLDILSESELENLDLLPADDEHVDSMITDINCSNEQFSELNENQTQINPTSGVDKSVQEAVASELSQAKILLSNAGEVLRSDFQCPPSKLCLEGVNMMPNIQDLLFPFEFRLTAFKLPQRKDASRYKDFQFQIAYFNYGITYLQLQALISLKTQARGIFIKETLRNINSKFSLNLENKDLETATYYIYHGKKSHFKNSVFAQKLRDRFPNEFREIPIQDFFGGDGFSRSLKRAVFPKFLDYLVRTEEEKSFRTVATATEMTWSTKTGVLLKKDSCDQNKSYEEL